MSKPNKEEEEAPFHVLMDSSRPTQQLLVRHDAIQGDYLARRFKYLNDDGKKESTIWSAVFPIERAMVECCQLPEMEQDNTNDNTVEMVGGSLSKGKERDFVRLLALHCHTAATRALALAILQRTIEQDNLEKEDDVVMEDTENPDDVRDEEKKGAKPEDDKAASDSAKHESTQDIGRMGRFLEAGGLKILKQWLLDAMTPCKTVVIKPKTISPAQQQQQKKDTSSTRVIQTVASPTGPLLLPLLSLLEDMPFDKGLVMSTKINKPIRKLRKNLDEAIAGRRRQTQKGDDEQWTSPVAGGLSVDEVQAEVAALMKTWEAKVKTSDVVTRDPFAALRQQMKERLELLKAYDAGDIEKPDFLKKFEEQDRLEREAEVVSKLTTEQRAARERQQERERMLKFTQQKKSEARAKLELLQKRSREESKKRSAEGRLGGDRKRSGRSVRWKDGLQNADNLRKRNLLEQVYVYPRESDYSGADEVDARQQDASVKQDPDESPL